MPGRSQGGRRSRHWRLAAWAAVAGVVLLIPLVAMQVSDEWDWGVFDFVFAGMLLFGGGLVFELVAQKGRTTAYRAAVGLAVTTAVIVVWANAAVGIIGDDEAVNLLYFGVPAVGAAGALIARLQPRGMARALGAAAIAQMLVSVMALAVPGLRNAVMEPPGVVGVLALNAVFALLWLASAWLFRKAAWTQKAGGHGVAA